MSENIPFTPPRSRSTWSSHPQATPGILQPRVFATNIKPNKLEQKKPVRTPFQELKSNFLHVAPATPKRQIKDKIEDYGFVDWEKKIKLLKEYSDLLKDNKTKTNEFTHMIPILQKDIMNGNPALVKSICSFLTDLINHENIENVKYLEMLFSVLNFLNPIMSSEGLAGVISLLKSSEFVLKEKIVVFAVDFIQNNLIRKLHECVLINYVNVLNCVIQVSDFSCIKLLRKFEKILLDFLQSPKLIVRSMAMKMYEDLSISAPSLTASVFAKSSKNVQNRVLIHSDYSRSNTSLIQNSLSKSKSHARIFSPHRKLFKGHSAPIKRWSPTRINKLIKFKLSKTNYVDDHEKENTPFKLEEPKLSEGILERSLKKSALKPQVSLSVEKFEQRSALFRKYRDERQSPSLKKYFTLYCSENATQSESNVETSISCESINIDNSVFSDAKVELFETPKKLACVFEHFEFDDIEIPADKKVAEFKAPEFACDESKSLLVNELILENNIQKVDASSCKFVSNIQIRPTKRFSSLSSRIVFAVMLILVVIFSLSHLFNFSFFKSLYMWNTRVVTEIQNSDIRQNENINFLLIESPITGVSDLNENNSSFHVESHREFNILFQSIEYDNVVVETFSTDSEILVVPKNELILMLPLDSNPESIEEFSDDVIYHSNSVAVESGNDLNLDPSSTSSLDYMKENINIEKENNVESTSAVSPHSAGNVEKIEYLQNTNEVKHVDDSVNQLESVAAEISTSKSNTPIKENWCEINSEFPMPSTILETNVLIPEKTSSTFPADMPKLESSSETVSYNSYIEVSKNSMLISELSFDRAIESDEIVPRDIIVSEPIIVSEQQADDLLTVKSFVSTVSTDMVYDQVEKLPDDSSWFYFSITIIPMSILFYILRAYLTSAKIVNPVNDEFVSTQNDAPVTENIEQARDITNVDIDKLLHPLPVSLGSYIAPESIQITVLEKEHRRIVTKTPLVRRSARLHVAPK